MQPQRSFRDWALLLSLVLIWGTAFSITKLALASVPAASVAAGRIVVAAMLLCLALPILGLRLPGSRRHWGYFFLMGTVGNALPFFLISWGQAQIDSGLAGILMAVMPLATLVMAHYFAHEPMTRVRALGFGIGFLGIVVLMGPEALLELGGEASDLARQAAVLGGALCYGANAIIVRRMPEMPPLVASAGTLIVASLVMGTIACFVDRPWQLEVTAQSAVSVLWLGVVATALATILYYALIASAGATFFALINYMIPIVAVVAGIFGLGEEPHVDAFLALALVLVGLALGQRLDPRGSSPAER